MVYRIELAFGTTANCLNQADQPHLQVLGNRAKSVVFFQFALQYGLMSVLQFMTPKYAREARRKHLALSAAKVQARLQAKNPGKDFMFYILENQEEKFSSLDLTLLASTFIVAGSNTTADTMTGLTYLLLRNPDKMALLKHEILTMFRSKDEITLQSTVHCRYLTACLEEAMRLRPALVSSFPVLGTILAPVLDKHALFLVYTKKTSRAIYFKTDYVYPVAYSLLD